MNNNNVFRKRKATTVLLLMGENESKLESVRKNLGAKMMKSNKSTSLDRLAAEG